jgi:hypothetical protein
MAAVSGLAAFAYPLHGEFPFSSLLWTVQAIARAVSSSTTCATAGCSRQRKRSRRALDQAGRLDADWVGGAAVHYGQCRVDCRPRACVLSSPQAGSLGRLLVNPAAPQSGDEGSGYRPSQLHCPIGRDAGQVVSRLGAAGQLLSLPSKTPCTRQSHSHKSAAPETMKCSRCPVQSPHPYY